MSMDLNKDVNVEALPVVPQFLKQNENGGVRCEVIKIEEYDGKQAVNARDLHSFLEIGKTFASWIKMQIDRCDLIEGVDYQALTQKVPCKNGVGWSMKTEYALTIDAAKEVSMMSQTERGKQARRYFIEAEKKFRESKSSLAIPDFTDPAIAARAWADQYEKNKRLTLENKLKQEALEQSTKEVAELQEEKRVNAPKVVFTDAVAGSKGNCLIGEVAKLITQNGYKMGQNQFFAWLRKNGYLGTKGERYNVPNQKYVGENGYFYIKKGVRQGNDGVLFNIRTPMVTPKGQIFFVNKFLNKGFEGELF